MKHTNSLLEIAQYTVINMDYLEHTILYKINIICTVFNVPVVVPTVVVDVVCAAVLEGGGPCVIGGAVGGAVEGTVGGVFVWVVDAVVGPVEVVAAVESVCVSEVPVEDEVDLLPGVLTANTVVDGVSGLGVVVAASVVVGGTVVVEGSSVTVGGAVVVVGLVVVMGGAVVVVGASVTVGGAVVVEGLSVD
jgi:hypothetical protein